MNRKKKESKLEYIEDVHIPTTEQATEDKQAAEIVSTLSLETKPVPLLPLPTFTTPFTPPKFSPIFTASTNKMASSSSTSKPDKMKFKSPLTFEGNRKDLNNFLAKCNLYFTYQGVTSKEKILFVMYLLDGRVADWRNTKVTEYNATPNKWKDYDAFVRELKDTWGEVDESGMALHRLFHYKKLTKTPLNQYVARVDQDIIQSGISDNKTKAHLLLLGLPTLMKERLRYGGAPTTYTTLRSRILDLEVANKIFSDFKFTHDPDAMQVDRMEIRQTATEWIANAKCYGCGKTGHLIADCPSPNKKRQNFGSSKGRFKGKPRRKFNPRNKGKGKGKACRIRSLKADDEEDDSENDTSEEESDKDDEDDERILIIQQLAKELPRSARRKLKKQGF